MNIRGQPQQDLVYISSFWLVCDPMNLMPAVVKSDSMDLLISVHIISGIAVEDGDLVRPIEPPPLICSPEKRALPTSWTIPSREHRRARRAAARLNAEEAVDQEPYKETATETN